MTKRTTRYTRGQRSAPAPTAVPPRNPYEVLGVLPGVTEEQLKQTYYRLAAQYHPDRHPGDKAAAERMSEINVAYNALCDVALRPKVEALHSARCPDCAGKGTKQRKQGFKVTNYTCPTCKGAKIVAKS